MNIFSRIFGVGVYFSSLIIVFLLLLKVNEKQRKTIMKVYLILLCAMSFFFVPNTGNDLFRNYSLMKIYSSEPFASFLARIQNYVSPLALVYFRYIGKLGINGLLPAITCLFYYSNLFYILDDFTKKHSFSKNAYAITLLFLMSNSFFIDGISGIRTMLAYSILIRCLYDEFYNFKSPFKHLLLYIMSALIHPIAIIAIFIRFLCIFIKNLSSKKIKNYIYLIFYLLICGILFYIGRKYVNSMFDVASRYISNNDSYSYLWEKIITIIILFIYFFTVFPLKNSEEIQIDNNKLFSKILFALILIFSFEHSIFTRFTNLMLFSSSPMLMVSFDKICKESKKKLLLLFIISILLLIVCIRGNLCSLKFW